MSSHFQDRDHDLKSQIDGNSLPSFLKPSKKQVETYLKSDSNAPLSLYYQRSKVDRVLLQEQFGFTYSAFLFFPEESLLEITTNHFISLYKEQLLPKELIKNSLKYHNRLIHPQHPEFEIRHVSTKSGFGLFAKQAIPQDTFIGEYVGIVQEDPSYFEFNDYLYKYRLYSNEHSDLVINARPLSNHVRFINHSKIPNLKPIYLLSEGILHLALFSLRAIHPGEQLTYDYGPHYWLLRGSPENY